ncbi:lanthionine synthetase LanC family protein [Flavobacterium sp. T12S277]|uniref:lanthionine synthetase LanC family protein n=1 Tax=Flavobacterium sp. T12S277 TaxID=3402752 RepID=UPI003AEA2036
MQDSILKIEKNIWQSFETEKRIGLLTGLSGIALFYSKMYTIYKLEDYLIKLTKVVEKVNEIIENEPSSSTLCSGLAGFGLALLHLEDHLIEIDTEYFEVIDSILLDDFRSFNQSNNYDFLHGSMGIAMYFIERCKYTKNENLISELNQFAEDLVNKISTDLKEVLTTETALDNDDKFCIYFGLAHGVAGYLNFLIYLERNFAELKSDIDTSLKIGIAFLQSYKNYNDNSKQYYPNLLLLESGSIINSRLSWCQGDFGISNALFNCGAYLEEDHLIKESEKLIQAARAISLEESLVSDFGLCHGSTGIALQYYLASKKLNIDCSEEIEKWLNIIHEQTSDYETFSSYEKGRYKSESNLLEGTVGLALTLFTLENKIDSKWLELINLF